MNKILRIDEIIKEYADYNEKTGKYDFYDGVYIYTDLEESYKESMFAAGYTPDNKISRFSVKQLGGKVIAIKEAGEVTYQIWKDKNGHYYYGNDWYNDNDAILYKAEELPF